MWWWLALGREGSRHVWAGWSLNQDTVMMQLDMAVMNAFKMLHISYFISNSRTQTIFFIVNCSWRLLPWNMQTFTCHELTPAWNFSYIYFRYKLIMCFQFLMQCGILCCCGCKRAGQCWSLWPWPEWCVARPTVNVSVNPHPLSPIIVCVIPPCECWTLHQPVSVLCAGVCGIPGGEFILGGNYLLLMCGLSLGNEGS